MIRNAAGQSIGVQMINATTGAAFTGTVTVWITGDAGTQAIGSVSSGVCTHEGNGYHTYQPSEDETAFDLIAFTFTGTGAIPQTIQIETLTSTQATALSLSTGSTVVTGLQIVTDAARELGVINAADVLSGDLVDQGLRLLNRIFDNWSAEHDAAYAQTFTTYTMTPSLSPHTIGPTGTFTVDQRSVSIEGASIVLTTSTPNVNVPLELRDAAWWDAQPVPDLESTIPSDLFYSPTWPNGSLYLWPVPSVAYGLAITTRVLLSQLLLTSTFSLPPGYWDAATKTLAEEWAGPLLVPLPPQLVRKAAQARQRIFRNNVSSPDLRTRDGGMPGVARGSYDYLTGRSD
jgi:hypothetical protein